MAGRPFPVLLACSMQGRQVESSWSCNSRRNGTVAWALGRGRAAKKEELSWGNAEEVTVGDVSAEEVTVGDVRAEATVAGVSIGDVGTEKTVDGVTIGNVSVERTVEEVTVADVSEESSRSSLIEGSRASELIAWKEEAQAVVPGQKASELSVWKEKGRAVMAGQGASEVTVWKEESKAVVVRRKDSELSVWKEEAQAVVVRRKDSELSVWKGGAQAVAAGQKASEVAVWKEEVKAVVVGQKAEVTVWKEGAKAAIIEQRELEEPHAAVIEQTGLGEHQVAVIKQRPLELIVWEEEAQALVIDDRASDKHQAAVAEAPIGPVQPFESTQTTHAAEAATGAFENSQKPPALDKHQAAVDEAMSGLHDTDPEEVFQWTHAPASAVQPFESTQTPRVAEAALVAQQQGIHDPSELSQTWKGEQQQPWQPQQKQQQLKKQRQGQGEQQEQKGGAEATADATVFDMSKLVQAVAYEAATNFSNAQGERSSFHQYLESVHERMTRQQLSASLEVQQVVGWAGVNYDILPRDVRRQRLEPISRALGYSDTQHLLEHYSAVYEAMQGLKSEGNLRHSREKSMSFELTQNTQHLLEHYTAVHEAMRGLESWGHGGGGEESVSFELTESTQHLLEHHRAVDEAMRGLESEESWEHSREESMSCELTQNTQHVLEHQRATVEAVGWEGEEMVGHSGGESMEPHTARHDEPRGAVWRGGGMQSDRVGEDRKGPRESELGASGEAHSSVQQRFGAAHSSKNTAVEEPNGSETGASLPFETGPTQSRTSHSSEQQSAAGTPFGPSHSNVEPHRSQTGAKPHSPQRSQSTPTSLSSSSAPAADPAHSARSNSSAPSAASAAVRSEWHLRAAAMRAAAALARATTPASITPPTTSAASATPPHPSFHPPVPPSAPPSSSAPASLPSSSAHPTSLSNPPSPPLSHPQAQAPSAPSWPADTHSPWSPWNLRGNGIQQEAPRYFTGRQAIIQASSVFESSEIEQEAPLVSTTTVRQDVIRASSVVQAAGHVSAQQVEWSSLREGHRVGRHSEPDSAVHPAVAALLARWRQTQFASVCFEGRPELKLPSLVRDAVGAEAREGENAEEGPVMPLEGLVMPLGSSTADVVVGGDAAAVEDAADHAAAEIAWLDSTLGSADGAAEAPASRAGTAAAAEEHVSWLETPLRSLARRSGGVLTPGQREKLEKAGMWTVRHLLEHYPHSYRDLTRSREDVMRDGQVAAVGVVENVSLTFLMHPSSFAASHASIVIRCITCIHRHSLHHMHPSPSAASHASIVIRCITCIHRHSLHHMHPSSFAASHASIVIRCITCIHRHSLHHMHPSSFAASHASIVIRCITCIHRHSLHHMHPSSFAASHASIAIRCITCIHRHSLHHMHPSSFAASHASIVIRCITCIHRHSLHHMHPSSFAASHASIVIRCITCIHRHSLHHMHPSSFAASHASIVIRCITCIHRHSLHHMHPSSFAASHASIVIRCITCIHRHSLHHMHPSSFAASHASLDALPLSGVFSMCLCVPICTSPLCTSPHPSAPLHIHPLRSVNPVSVGSCAVALLRIRCNPPDSAATTASGPRFSVPGSTSSSGSSGNSGGGFVVTAKQFRAGSWGQKALYSAYPRGCLVSVTGQVGASGGTRVGEGGGRWGHGVGAGGGRWGQVGAGGGRWVHGDSEAVPRWELGSDSSLLRLPQGQQMAAEEMVALCGCAYSQHLFPPQGDGTFELDMNSDIVRVDAGRSRGEGGHVPCQNLLLCPTILTPCPCALQVRVVQGDGTFELDMNSDIVKVDGGGSRGEGAVPVYSARKDVDPLLLRVILESLPYTLTAGQMQAAREIISDMNWPVPMSRLLQGDVGCGKTVVALLACIEAVAHGYQVAVMAPTQFLAQQHVARFEQLLQALPPARRPKVCLLTASVKRAKALRLDIKEGRVDIIIGTHALIARATAFHRLGLAIVDEQHRFGVKQRARLHEKVGESEGVG
ncbi:unnamed protein product [Closterium sp. Yama58-4]|nr:unnamed protein product [Closterium sp. Yama58-4]